MKTYIALLVYHLPFFISKYEYIRYFKFVSLRPVWIEGGGEGVERSRVKLIKNKLILGQIYSTPPLSPSIQMDHKGLSDPSTFGKNVWYRMG